MYYLQNKLPSFSDLYKAMKKSNYEIFENDKKEYNLNIVGFRSGDQTPNTFNDRFYMFWKYKGCWNNYSMDITTDPGLYYLENPINVNGTAILKAGQYPKCWEFGLHQGKYEALCQVGFMTVIRDADRNSAFDFNGKEDTNRNFGINFHRATRHVGKESKQVDKWSAGCQVVPSYDEYMIAMRIVKESKKIWGPRFTYTLLDENNF